jgi:SAM-dependent methyltransferase
MPFLVTLARHVTDAERLIPQCRAVHRSGLVFLKATKAHLELVRFQKPDTIERYLDVFYILSTRPGSTSAELYGRLFDAIGAHYERYIESARNRRNITFMLRYVRGAVKWATGDWLLDYGCGPGLSVAVAQALKLPWTLVGVDRCDVMRQRARIRGLRTLTIQQIGRIRTPRFGAVIASYVLHLPTAAEGLSAVWRQLRPGGVLIGNCHKGRGQHRIVGVLERFGGKAQRLSATASQENGSYVVYRKVAV